MLRRCFVSGYQYLLLTMGKIDESLFDKLVEMIFNSRENPIAKHVFYIHKEPDARLLASDSVPQNREHQFYIVYINVEISSVGLIISAIDNEVVKVIQ